ncbi:heterokaryon incompatibility protein-domain-containing protein [Cladochytrium replicatum]|nr:heterokaryon incompatibility protein-domain-containing protein [Cladochytrium replicatum]
MPLNFGLTPFMLKLRALSTVALRIVTTPELFDKESRDACYLMLKHTSLLRVLIQPQAPRNVHRIPPLTIDWRNSTVSTTPSGAPYSIVSHVWGSDIAKRTAKELKIADGVTWNVPLNGHFWKCRFWELMPEAWRDQFLCDRVWMDVLCMNQDSPSEIHAQVECMGDYYRNAKHCIVLLESLTEDQVMALKSAIELVKPGGDYASQSGCWDQLSDEQRDALTALSKDPWLVRLWTLQEALLPKSLVFMIIGDSPEEELENVDSVRGRTIVEDNLLELVSQIVGGSNAATIDGRVKFEHPMDTSISTLSDPGFRKMTEALGGTTTGMLLSQAAVRQSSWPEDRIYGILGALGYKVDVKYHDDREDSAGIMNVVRGSLGQLAACALESQDATALFFLGKANTVDTESKAHWYPTGPHSFISTSSTPPVHIHSLSLDPSSLQLSLSCRLVGKVHSSATPVFFEHTFGEEVGMHLLAWKLFGYLMFMGADAERIVRATIGSHHPEAEEFKAFAGRVIKEDQTPPNRIQQHAIGVMMANHPYMAREATKAITVTGIEEEYSPTKKCFGFMTLNAIPKTEPWGVYDIGLVGGAGVRRFIGT